MRNFGTMSPLFALLGGAAMALGFGDNRCTAAESETAPPPGIYAPDEWQFSSPCPWEEMAAAAARRVAEELPDHFDNGSEWVDPATLADAERDAYAAAQQDAEAAESASDYAEEYDYSKYGYHYGYKYAYPEQFSGLSALAPAADEASSEESDWTYDDAADSEAADAAAYGDGYSYDHAGSYGDEYAYDACADEDEAAAAEPACDPYAYEDSADDEYRTATSIRMTTACPATSTPTTRTRGGGGGRGRVLVRGRHVRRRVQLRFVC